MHKKIRVRNPLTGLYFELRPNYSRYGHSGEIAGIWGSKGYGDQKDMGIKRIWGSKGYGDKKMDLMNRPIKDVVKFSNTIAWYKEDCEICGQGSFLCDDSRCPINSSISFYDKKKEETIKMRANRGIIKRLAAMILNEDDKTISR